MRVLFFFLTIFITFSASSQIEIQLIQGYGFSTRADNSEYNTLQLDLSKYQKSIVGTYYGQGFISGIGIYYHLNPNFEAGLHCSLLNGIPFYRSNIGLDSLSIWAEKTQAKIWRIVPEMRFHLPLNSWDFFIGTGLIAGLKGQIINEINTYTYINANSEYTLTITTKFTGGFSWGFTNSIGIKKTFGRNLSISLYFQSYAHSWGPTSSEITASFLNGEDKLSDNTVSETYSIYKNRYIYSISPGNNLEDKPGIYPRPHYSFSSLGLYLGLNYRFMKK